MSAELDPRALRMRPDDGGASVTYQHASVLRAAERRYGPPGPEWVERWIGTARCHRCGERATGTEAEMFDFELLHSLCEAKA